MIATKNNVSTMFLVRPLGIVDYKETNLNSSTLREMGFVRAFIRDIQAQDLYSHPVVLLFEVRDEKINQALEKFIAEEYDRCEEYDPSKGILIDDYDYPGYIVMVYEFPEVYQEDYKKILNGKYSKCSEAFKHIFPEKMKPEGEDFEVKTHAYKVFNRTDQLRKELEDSLGMELPRDSEVESVGNFDNDPKSPLPKEVLDITDYVQL